MTQLMAAADAALTPDAGLTGTQKAAVIVRLLLAEGAGLPLAKLPEPLQDELANQIASMGFVDRMTLKSVIDEFVLKLDSVGLSFPRNIEGTLELLDGHISAGTAARLRKQAGINWLADPWPRFADLGAEALLPVLERESLQVGAILLSKLTTSLAAEVLQLLPGDRARRLTYEMSKVGTVHPDTVRRIGIAILADLDEKPARAFDIGPVERVGAILNSARSETRDDVLTGLDETDRGFADEVRRAIFTFDNLPQRLAPRDVSKVVREIDQKVLLTALAGAKTVGRQEPADFILDNISQRMADALRDEINDLAAPRPEDGEAAMGEIISLIRRLESEGELYLLADEDTQGEEA